MIFLLNSVLALIMSNLYERQHPIPFLKLYVPAVFSALSMFPLYYIYIKKLVSIDKYGFKQWYKHLMIPFLCMILGWILVYQTTTSEGRFEWISNLVFEKPRVSLQYAYLNTFDSVMRKLFLVLSVIYFYLTIRTINDYKTTINQFFSNYESVSLSWFTIFKYSYSLSILAAFAYFSLGRYATSQTVILPLISHCLLAVFFWNAGYFGKQQNRIHIETDSNAEVDTSSIYDKIGIGLKLLEQLDEKQVYRDKDLSLVKLAQLIGTNRSYLSNYINQELNTNFNDLINEKRVNYAQILLANEDMKVYEICEVSGFNSISSFYRAFKKFTGYTPGNMED